MTQMKRMTVGVAGVLMLCAACVCASAPTRFSAEGAITRLGRTPAENLLTEPVRMRIIERAFVGQEADRVTPVQPGTKIIVENQHRVLDGLNLLGARRKVRRVIEDTDVPATRVSATGCTKRVRDAELTWTVNREPVGSGVKLTVAFRNRSKRLRSLDVEFPVLLTGDDYEAFFPGQNDFPEWSEGSALAYGLRSNEWTRYNNYLSQPLCTLFAAGRDVGVTLASDYSYPILPITFYAAKSGGGTAVLVTFLRVRLDPKGRRTIILHLQPHRGDWRCGLAFARDTWPDRFMVGARASDCLTPVFGGTGSLGNYYPECFTQPSFFRNYLWKWNPRHRFTIEMMGLDHWHGQYMSEVPRWTNALAEKWRHINTNPEWYPDGFLTDKPDRDAPHAQIVRWLESRPESMFEQVFRRGFREQLAQTVYYWFKTDRDGVKRFIRTATTHGSPMFMYWNPRDVWYPFARDRFSDLIIGRDENYFGFHVAYTVPVAGSRFYKYQKSQLDRMLSQYTGLDGFFIDQCYGAGALAGKDDGVTVTDEGKPAAEFNIALAAMTTAARQIARKHGKLVWANHCHETIDIAGNADLACAEDRQAAGMGQEVARYALIGNRPGVNLHRGELVMQASLRNGMVGQTAQVGGLGVDDYETRGDPDPAWACRLYQPMFDLVRDKQWCLEPHCLTLPDGFDGNLFRIDRNRSLLATVIASGEYFHTSWTRLDVPVTINVTDASDINATYLVGAANLGAFKIPFERSGNRVTVEIPRFKGTASVLFAKAGRFVSVDTDSPVASANGTWTYNFVADNFTHEPWRWQGTVWIGRTPWWHWKVIPAGESTTTPFKVELPADYERAFTTVMLAKEAVSLLPSEDGAEHHYSTFEFFVETPVTVSIAPSRAMVRKTLSNSTQGGYQALYHPFPLHLVQEETAEFTLGIANNSSAAGVFTVEIVPTGLVVDDASPTVRMEPGSRANLTLTGTARTRGPAGLRVTLKDRNGAVVAADELRFPVFGRTLSEADLAQVESVSLYYDIWGSTRTDGADTRTIAMNGVNVGKLAGSGGYQTWVTRVKTALDTAASAALQTDNEIALGNPTDSFWKVRNLFLEVQLVDGSMVHQLSDSAAISSPADNPWSEGRRLQPGEAVNIAFR